MKVKEIKNLCWTWMCMMLFVLIACDESDGEKNIIFSNAKEKEQTIAASKTEGEVTFAAVADWQASVVSGSGTRAATPNWITINPDHGPAGNQTIKITLLLNNTGADRSATIKLMCGEETVSISITQEKQKEGETIEPEPTAKWLVDKVENIRYYNGYDEPVTTVTKFAYDENKRIVLVEGLSDNGEKNTFTYTYLEQEIKESIKQLSKYNGKFHEANGKIDYVLDDQGKVISWASEFLEDVGEPSVHEGTLGYSTDDYLLRSVRTDGYNSSFDWANNNLIRINNSGSVSTMKYGTQLNNLDINLDLNWAFNSTEWISTAVFNGVDGLRAFALGNRSKYYITEEEGHTKYDEGYYTRSYEFDNFNRPSKVTVMHITEKGVEKLSAVYTISYIKEQ